MAAIRASLASRNEGKLAEFRALFPGWEIELLDLDGFPEEDGETYYDNARSKARFGRTVGEPEVWMLGDDSGIELEALGGEPGVQTARWAGGDHVGKLLGALEGTEDRRARYVCELVCVSPGLEELRGTGTLEGEIAAAPAGRGGFGFDPVFVPDGETRTVAELGAEWKRRHSHRARAAAALLAAIGAA